MAEFSISGRFVKITETKSGTSKKGKDWKSVRFLITSDENNYVFSTLDPDLIEVIEKAQTGVETDITFNVKTNEWQGKYYTDLVLKEISFGVKEETIQAESTSTDDGLPF